MSVVRTRCVPLLAVLLFALTAPSAGDAKGYSSVVLVGSDGRSTVIAGHYEQAGETAGAADWYARAGQQAQRTGAQAAASDYYQKALDFLPRAGDYVARRMRLARPDLFPNLLTLDS